MKEVLSQPRGYADQPQDFHWLEKNIPCQAACPAKTDIPAYLAAIARGDYDLAYRINLEDNIFPAILGRVCSRPCEPPCRHGWEGLGDPVAICFSKRSAADFRAKPEPLTLPPLFPPSGKAVAVVGAGVAGLAAARQLALWGHAVTVYEKHERPGGMLNQGIPEFRLPRSYIDREIAQVEKQGVQIVCGTGIGRDLPLKKLLKTNDAVIMAAGTLRPNVLALAGNDLRGVEHGLPFLLQTNEFGRRRIGARVIVIGGGFTAIDCARTALRLGARSVHVYYRRSMNEMLITPGELEEMEEEGIPIGFMVSPKGFVGEEGCVSGVRFVRTRLGEMDASGRRSPVEVGGSEFVEPADTVLLATGQFPDPAWIDPGLQGRLVGEDQWLLNGRKHHTAIDNLFVAGDFATGASTLIDAIGHAKRCARLVDEYLMSEKRLVDAVHVEDGRDQARTRTMDEIGRHPIPTLPVAERHLEEEVEVGYDEDTSRREAQRCYLCHYKYEIDMDVCIYCDQCVEVKPREQCIVKVSDLVTDEEGRIVGWHEAEDVLNKPTMHEYFINQEDCIRCNACLEVCPVDCISVQKVSLATLPRGSFPVGDASPAERPAAPSAAG